jgi:antitoxin ParD1/3/4
MTARVTVSLPDQLHDFADAQVGQGVYATMSAAVAAGLQALREREEEKQAVMNALADEIRRRAELPDEDYVLHSEGDFNAIVDDLTGPGDRA